MAGIALGGLGLLFLLIGPIIRLPLERRATRISYLGAAIGVLAIVWLVLTFQGGRSQRVIVFGTYAIGMAVIALGAILVPMLSERDSSTADAAEAAASAASARADADRAQEDAEAANAEADELRDEVAALSDELAALHESQANFELYEDRSGKYRWHLRYRNSNIIADSAQGYARRAGAQNGIESVRRNALGGALVDLDEELAEPTEDADEGVVAYPPGESKATFEVYEDAAGDYRWRLEAGNGEVVADSGQGFSREQGARDSIERVEGHAAGAAVLDVGLAAFEVYEDSAGEFRWRLRHRNGNILADGGEGYSSRTKAFDGIDSVKRNAPNAEATDA